MSLLLACGPASGCAYFRWGQTSSYPEAPIVFQEQPELDDLIAAINRNDKIQRMESTGTSVELLDASLPINRLDASLSVERPGRLRLQARMPMLLSSSLDVGSNDELFWMRYPDGMHQTLLYARHGEYDRVMPSGPLPINPSWIVQALGLTHIERQQITEGPLPTGNGAVELRLNMPTGAGLYRHVLKVDAARGFVLSHTIYDPGGRLVAQAETAEHGYYEEHGVILPHEVRVRLQPLNAPPIALQIEIQKYVINQFLGTDPNRFQLPTDGNAQVIDLVQLGNSQPTMPQAAPTGNSPRPGPNLPPATLPPATLPYTGLPGPASTTSQPAPTSQTVPAEPVTQYVPTAARGPILRGTSLR